MKVAKNFLNDIPFEKRDFVLNKMERFEYILLKSRSLTDIPKGFWIRRVAGTDVYKFRVNSGDRVLFKYKDRGSKDEVIFLSWCNHDEQIRVAKDYSGQGSVIDFEIDKQDYIEDQFDEDLDDYIRNEVYYKLSEIENELVIEDEYIALSVEEANISNMYFLSLEQYHCLRNVDRPSIVFGCAGSGKTMVAVRKLIMNSDLMIDTAYITCSNMIRDKTEQTFLEFADNPEDISFYTFRELCMSIIGLKEDTIVIGYDDFYKWMSKNELLKEESPELNIRLIWIEINTIIKGYAREDDHEDMLSRKEYLEYEKSSFDAKTKNIIYRVAKTYNYWLRSNNYYDENDLAALALQKLDGNHPFTYVIYDEIQELTNRQILLVISLVKNIDNIMLFGDINQSLDIDKYDIEFLKNSIYKRGSILSQYFIGKNYRNGSGTVFWINEFKQLKNEQFKSVSSNFRQSEQSVRDGDRPGLLYDLQSEEEFFYRIDDDVNSIVIVPDESHKNALQAKNYDLGRVFSIRDIRGLEYDNIYCYNILSSFEGIWDKVLSEDIKSNDIYAIYFNMVYIAVTRTRSRVYFIEEGPTKLDHKLNHCWDIIDDESIVLNSIGITGDRRDWLEEAIKLEKMENYYQAAEAYKKAGRLFDAEICLKAHEREVDYRNVEEFASFVFIRGKELDEQLLEEVLHQIEVQYNLHVSGHVELTMDIVKSMQSTYWRRANYTRYIEKDLTNREIAQIIFDNLNKDYLSKEGVLLKTCFYRDGEAINTENIPDNGFSDLYVEAFPGDIKVIKTFYTDLRANELYMEAIKDENQEELGFELINQALAVRGELEYASKDADDILDFIFKGEN